jgi:hypothetical protein
MIFAVSILTIMMTFVLGQAVPVSGQTIPAGVTLVQRDFSYLNDQHLTASNGNTKVCGDHLCAPGEWSALQENLNKAQIGNFTATSTKTMPNTTNSTSSTNSTSTAMHVTTTNSTSAVTILPTPVPIPTPPPVSYSVCNAVKTALGNSTVSSNTIAKIMNDLGCSQ